MPAFALMLQGDFYDPITQGYTLSDLGVRSWFKTASRDSTLVFLCDLCHLFVHCICTSEHVLWERCGCEEDQLLKLVFLTVTFTMCIQVFYFVFISLTVTCLTETDTSKKHVNTCNIRLGHSTLLTVVSRNKWHIFNRKTKRCRRT